MSSGRFNNGQARGGQPRTATRRPTLADVAARAGTSTAVVSYVLNHGPRPVSETLRTRVLAALNELDYRVDRRAQALRRPRRWQQIGLLVPDLTMPLFGSYIGCVEREARARDHLTMIGNTAYDPERELEFATAFTETGIDGLLVVGAVNTVQTAELCARERVPVMWMHSVRGTITADVVGSDHVQSGALVTRHLVEHHRCRNVAFVGGYTESDVAYGDRETVKRRAEGFASVVEGEGLLIRTDLTARNAYTQVSAHLRSARRPPDGLVVGTLAQATAAIRAVIDTGLDVPDDVRVVGFDGPEQDYGRPCLTTLRQPVRAIVGHALDRLLSRSIDALPPLAPAKPDELRLGESCGCLKSPAAARGR